MKPGDAVWVATQSGEWAEGFLLELVQREARRAWWLAYRTPHISRKGDWVVGISLEAGIRSRDRSQRGADRPEE